MRIFVISVIVFSFCHYSCKKKKNQTDPEQPLTPTAYQGVFKSSIYAVGNGTSFITYNPINDAFISSQPLNHAMWNPTTLVDAGNISLNGVIFNKHLSVPYYYRDTTSQLYNPPHVWSITGTGSIPAFTFTNTNSYPVFNGYTSLPDSFQISSGVSIPVNNYNNVDEMQVLFQAQNGNVTSYKYFPGNVNSIQFSASEVNKIGISKNNTLIITFYKYTTQTIHGNEYIFRTAYLLRKQGIKFK